MTANKSLAKLSASAMIPICLIAGVASAAETKHTAKETFEEAYEQFMLEKHGLNSATARAASVQQALSIDRANELRETLGDKLLSTEIDTPTGKLEVFVGTEQLADQIRSKDVKATVVQNFAELNEFKDLTSDVIDEFDVEEYWVSFNTDYSGLNVVLGESSGSSTVETGEIADALNTGAFPVAVSSLGTTVPFRTQSTFNAGDEVELASGTKCTAGFIIRHANGSIRGTTAGHCGRLRLLAQMLDLYCQTGSTPHLPTS